jgi:hypothetical protein
LQPRKDIAANARVPMDKRRALIDWLGENNDDWGEDDRTQTVADCLLEEHITVDLVQRMSEEKLQKISGLKMGDRMMILQARGEEDK